MIQGSEDWKEKRKNYITSTDAASIMGQNPWQTLEQIRCEKLDLAPERTKTEAMSKGLELEPQGRNWFFNHSGIVVEPKVLYKDFLMASLDGYSEKANCLLEIKCSKKTYDLALQGEIPMYYQCQIQHQLITSGCIVAFYVAYWKDKGEIISLKPDKAFQEEYMPKALEFYESFIHARRQILAERVVA